MKHIIVLLFLMGTFVVSAQGGSETRSLTAFTELKVFDGLSVNLVPSTENKAVLTGEDLDKVVIVNNDGILKIRMQITKFFSGYKTFIDLHYSAPLVIIDVNEDALIQGDTEMEQDILELRAQEGGEVKVQAKVSQMLIKSVTGGIITANGTAEAQDVQINTGGKYLGSKLLTKISTVNVNAGSKAEVFATDYVKASVKAGGEVLIYGNPKSLDEKTVFGGVITKM
ncbi:head GIN domain-containing protein [Maribacter sp. 2307ULW6-5]|uniref:head GIN domain-containing protein n=1 Tax=Maribacter sp. 2307ULW6-5 TaxID=3386275 RepID=UPI0039BD087F